MGTSRYLANLIVAAAWAAVGFSLPATAQTPELDRLFERLAQPELPEWQTVEADIWRHWSRSGSAAMDLLLQRGRDAIEAGDLGAAIEHLTALTDHAPDFAEGWNARATAFYRAGHYGLAIEDIRRTLALNPRHFGALSGLGMILEEIGWPDSALSAWRAAHAIHPHRPDVEQAISRLELRVAGIDL